MEMTNLEIGIKTVQSCLYAAEADGFSENEAQLLADVYRGILQGLSDSEGAEFESKLSQMAMAGEIDYVNLRAVRYWV